MTTELFSSIPLERRKKLRQELEFLLLQMESKPYEDVTKIAKYVSYHNEEEQEYLDFLMKMYFWSMS